MASSLAVLGFSSMDGVSLVFSLLGLCAFWRAYVGGDLTNITRQVSSLSHLEFGCFVCSMSVISSLFDGWYFWSFGPLFPRLHEGWQDIPLC
jgi:hypothetical protein